MPAYPAACCRVSACNCFHERTCAITRKKTRQIRVGNVPSAGMPRGGPVHDLDGHADVKATVEQIGRLEEAGCEIVRVAVLDEDAALAIGDIRKPSGSRSSPISISVTEWPSSPWRMAPNASVNPGNLGREKIGRSSLWRRPVAPPCGSVSTRAPWRRSCWRNTAAPAPRPRRERAGQHCLPGGSRLSRVQALAQILRCATMIRAYRMISEKTETPLHLGVTEPAACLPRASSPPSGSGSCFTKGSATRSGCPSQAIRPSR